MRIELASEIDFKGWRDAAREACRRDLRPENLRWVTPGSEDDLFAPGPVAHLKQNREDDRKVVAPKPFLQTAERVVCLREPERFSRLYRILWRYQKERRLFQNAADPDMVWLNSGEKLIRRDVHKMHAFVRFRKAGETEEGREQFAAWFEPTYRIERLAAPFFQKRFANMDWVIVTPEASIFWSDGQLIFGDGGKPQDVPSADALEDHWRTYFSSIFNPARLKISAMTSEMPKKYWRNLPEADLIPDLIRSAHARERGMAENAPTLPSPLSETLAARQTEDLELPGTPQDLSSLNAALKSCRRCELADCASQSVCGTGPTNARIMLVGEQPGDQEDIAGKPFVGPAGQLLDECLQKAGIDRSMLYLTNAVKHFRFEARGKRRLHKSPSAGHIDTCRWWLTQEIEFVRPDIIVAMGLSAARSLLRQTVKLGDVRGQPIRLPEGQILFVTCHPSSLLRQPDAERQTAETEAFICDLREASRFLGGGQAAIS